MTHAQTRNRRPSQRRQIHALQRPDLREGAGRELSVRHRSIPTPAIVQVPDPRLDALAAWSARAHRAGGRWSSWTSPAWSRAPARARGWATSSWRNIREVDAIVHVVRCFEDDDVQHVMGSVDPGARPRDHRHRARTGRPRERREAARQVRPAPPSRATPRPGSSCGCSKQVQPALAAGRPARAVVPTEEETRRLPLVQPADVETGPLRRQRGRGRDRRRQRASSRRSAGRSRPTARRPRSSPSRPRWKPSWPSCRRRTGRSSSNRSGLTESGLDRLAHARLPPARPPELFHGG